MQRRVITSRVGWEPPGWNPASTISLGGSEPTDSVSVPSGQLPGELVHSSSSLSKSAPPTMPTGIRTQNRAAVPKISEAINVESGGHPLCRPGCPQWLLVLLLVGSRDLAAPGRRPLGAAG